MKEKDFGGKFRAELASAAEEQADLHEDVFTEEDRLRVLDAFDAARKRGPDTGLLSRLLPAVLGRPLHLRNRAVPRADVGLLPGSLWCRSPGGTKTREVPAERFNERDKFLYAFHR